MPSKMRMVPRTQKRSSIIPSAVIEILCVELSYTLTSNDPNHSSGGPTVDRDGPNGSACKALNLHLEASKIEIHHINGSSSTGNMDNQQMDPSSFLGGPRTVKLDIYS